MSIEELLLKLPFKISKTDKTRQEKHYVLNIKKNQDSWQVSYLWEKELKGRPYDGLGYCSSQCLFYTNQISLQDSLETIYNVLIKFKYVEDNN